jgi:hypothetical protein
MAFGIDVRTSLVIMLVAPQEGCYALSVHTDRGGVAFVAAAMEIVHRDV